MYREGNTDTRHVTGITRPPITEFPITRPLSPSSPISDKRADFEKVNVFSCNSLGLYVLPLMGSWRHVDLMGFVSTNPANGEHVFTIST
jgi:hypothetical protein